MDSVDKIFKGVMQAVDGAKELIDSALTDDVKAVLSEEELDLISESMDSFNLGKMDISDKTNHINDLIKRTNAAINNRG